MDRGRLHGWFFRTMPDLGVTHVCVDAATVADSTYVQPAIEATQEVVYKKKIKSKNLAKIQLFCLILHFYLRT